MGVLPSPDAEVGAWVIMWQPDVGMLGQTERLRAMSESKRFTDRIEEAIQEARARYIVDGNPVNPDPDEPVLRQPTPNKKRNDEEPAEPANGPPSEASDY
jgi:hypothetical protein